MSQISRRSLLRAGVFAAVAVPLSDVLLPTDAAFASVLTRSGFAPYRGQRFAMTSPWAGTALTLAGIEDLPNAPRGDLKRFSLVFRLAAGKRPTQGTWTLNHPKMGRVTLFLVPVGRSGDLQAVFNAH